MPAIRKRILICDDEPEMTRLVGKLLAFAAFEVTAVNEPRAVIPALERGGYDLAVLDLLMPHLEGGDIVEALRRRGDALRDLPVIVLTAKILSPDERSALRRAGATIVEKPLRIEAFIQTIRQALGARGER